MKTFKIFFQLLNIKEKKEFSLLIFLMTIGTLLEAISLGLLIPLFNSVINQNYIDHLSTQWGFIKLIDSSNFIIYLIIFLFAVYSFKYSYNIFVNFFLYKFIFKVKERVGSNLFLDYLKKDYIFYKKNDISSFVKNLTTEIDQFGSSIVAYLSIFSEISLLLGIIIAIVLTQQIEVIILIIIILSILIFVVLTTKNKIKNIANTRYSNQKKISQIILDSFGVITEILLKKKQDFFLTKYKEKNTLICKALEKHNFYQTLPRVVLEWLFFSIIMLGLIIGTLKETNITSIIPNLAFLTIIVFKTLPSVIRILVFNQQIRFTSPTYEMFRKTREVSEENNKKKKIIENFKSLELKNISYQYNENNKILNKLNFKIKKNDFIGIYGDSGSGKSTLINILIGLFKPYSGEIYYNNQDTQNLSLEYDKFFSVVPQQMYLLSDTLENNIVFGETKNAVDDALLQQCIKNAGLENTLVKNLESAKDFFISEGGRNLSGGQVQRVGIARALYSKPQIIVLDEATSALDYDIERKIINSLFSIKKEITLIMISHKRSNFDKFDKIYKLHDKKLILEDEKTPNWKK